MIQQLDDPPGLLLEGEIDVSDRDTLRRALAALPPARELHLQLDGLRFIDGGSAGALTAYAVAHPDRRLVLHQPPPVLRRLLTLIGPAVDWDVAS